METLRSPLRQVTVCRIFSLLLILFAISTLGEEPSVMPTEEPDSTEPSALADSTHSMTPGTVAKEIVTKGKSKEATSQNTLSPEKLSTAKHLDTVPAAEQQQPTPKEAELPQSTKDTRDPVSANATPAMVTTEVVQTPNATNGKSASNGRPATTVSSTGLKPRSSKGKKEMNATSGEPVHDDPAKHNSSKLHETQNTTVTSTTKSPEADLGVKESPSKGSGGVTVMSTRTALEPDVETTTSPSKHPRGPTVTPIITTPGTTSPTKASKGAIVAIVLCVLLLLVLLLVVLYCRRRRHSGSTSFKSATWAGQAVVPDDPGMDKEVEQGAPSPGAGETRRATLTTFFGKRQSRVPSVAMEEVQKEKVNVEETQRLMDGDAGRVAGPEGSGEANGKVLESPMQRSQDTEFPPPPANQEGTPPTKP